MTESQNNIKLIRNELSIIKTKIIDYYKKIKDKENKDNLDIKNGISLILLFEEILIHYPNKFGMYYEEDYESFYSFSDFEVLFKNLRIEIEDLYKTLPFLNIVRFENLLNKVTELIEKIIDLTEIPDNEIEFLFNSNKNNLFINDFESKVKVKEENIDELESEIKRLREQIVSDNSSELKEVLEKKGEELNKAVEEKQKLEKKAKEYDEYLNETNKIKQAIDKLKNPSKELIESKKIFEKNRDNYNEYAMQLFKIGIVAFILIILNIFFFVGINDISKSEKVINLSFYLINVFPILFPTILGFLFIRQSNINSQEVQKINRRFILIHEVNQSLQALVEVNRGKEMDNKTEKIIDKLIENILNYASEANSTNINNKDMNFIELNKSIDNLIDTIDKKVNIFKQNQD